MPIHEDFEVIFNNARNQKINFYHAQAALVSVGA